MVQNPAHCDVPDFFYALKTADAPRCCMGQALAQDVMP